LEFGISESEVRGRRRKELSLLPAGEHQHPRLDRSKKVLATAERMDGEQASEGQKVPQQVLTYVDLCRAFES
jgi:hypothetical protein